MKALFLVVMTTILLSSVAIPVNAVQQQNTPFVDDFENYPAGDDASSVWEEVYHYEDGYSTGGAEVVSDGSQVLEVSRSYLWHNTFNKVFFSKMKVVSSSGDYEWYGSRIALVNPNNPLERYELRLYPHKDKVQINYVDRTNRTGNMEEDLTGTTSEIVVSEDCNIEVGKWYYTLLMRSGNKKWKAMVFSWNRPTCYLSWKDKEIGVKNPAIGIQSAGKYVTTRFDEIFAI